MFVFGHPRIASSQFYSRDRQVHRPPVRFSSNSRRRSPTNEKRIESLIFQFGGRHLLTTVRDKIVYIYIYTKTNIKSVTGKLSHFWDVVTRALRPSPKLFLFLRQPLLGLITQVISPYIQNIQLSSSHDVWPTY